MSGRGDTTGKGGLHPIVASTAAELLPGFLDWIADAPADPFDPQVVVVPNVGMAEHLESAIRHRFGVCANVEFLFPGRLRERSGIPATWPWSVEEATWMILAALDDVALAEACGLTARLEERPLAVARHIAELVDRYHSYRPGLIEAWRNGEFVDDLGGAVLDERFRWQYDLFRAVDGANLRPEPSPRRLPERIALFGTGAPVGAQADLVHALAHDLDVTAFLLVPGPLPSALERWAAPAVAALPRFVGGTERPAEPATLPEVELHLCYGPAREFDAARDAILERFAADPVLTARDVTVVSPAIDRTAPLAAPILGTPIDADATGEVRRLPVRIADRVPSLTPSVALAIDGVLGLAAGRCRATEVLAVLRLEPVAAAFGLSADAAERVSAWVLDGLDVRWGLDGEHRTHWGYDAALTVGAWAPAVDRLLAGLLLQNPDGSTRAVEATDNVLVPFDDVSGSEFAFVGAVAEFVGALRDLAARVDRTPRLGTWADILEDLLATFIADSPATRREVNATRHIVEAVRSRAGTIARRVSVGEFRGLVATAFDDRTGSARNRFDAVTIGGTRARRGVTHRIAAIVGLTDDATRASTVSGDDLLAATAGDRPWEADRSAEARLAVLDALLGTQCAIITTTAFDIVTNRDLGIPVVVEELADAIPDLRLALGGERAEHARVVRHHRRLADDRTYDPAGPAWARALDADSARPERIVTPADRDEALGLADLTAAYLRPHDLYLREGLGATLPPSIEDREEDVDLAIGGLQDAVLTSRLLAHLASGGRFEDWTAAISASESLPPLLLGEQALTGLVHDVAGLVDLALGNGAWPKDLDDESVARRRAAVEAGYAPERVRIELEVPFGQGTVSIDAAVETVGDATLIIHHGELRGRHLIEAWVRLALLARAQPRIAWRARLAGYRSARIGGQQVLEPVARQVTIRPDSAERILNHVLCVRELARTLPIAVFPRATTVLALGDVGAQGTSGWKLPSAVPTELGKAFGEFRSPLSYDIQRAATAWCFGDATSDSLALMAPTDTELGVLPAEATADSCAALAYARHLHLAFTRTAIISKALDGTP